MVKKLILIVFIFLGIVNVVNAQSMFDSGLFTAQVLRLDKTKSGKVYISIELKGKSTLKDTVLEIRAKGECLKSAVLIDSEGNEYYSTRCLDKINIYEKSISSFLLEFSTPIANTNTNSTYTLMIPFIWQHEYLSPYAWPKLNARAESMINFSDLNLKKF